MAYDLSGSRPVDGESGSGGHRSPHVLAGSSCGGSGRPGGQTSLAAGDPNLDDDGGGRHGHRDPHRTNDPGDAASGELSSLRRGCSELPRLAFGHTGNRP